MNKKFGNIISWIVFGLMAAFLLFSVFTVYNSKITSQEAYMFGYRPVFIMTGSMEPCLKTNGVAITKKIDSINEIDVEDIITYHVNTDSGDTIKITHRIIDIDDNGIITTKGDNNMVPDNYDLTIDNVESKVVFICNWIASLISMWNTTSGKILIIGIPVCVILLFMSIKYFIKK